MFSSSVAEQKSACQAWSDEEATRDGPFGGHVATCGSSYEVAVTTDQQRLDGRSMPEAMLELLDLLNGGSARSVPRRLYVT